MYAWLYLDTLKIQNIVYLQEGNQVIWGHEWIEIFFLYCFVVSEFGAIKMYYLFNK